MGLLGTCGNCIDYKAEAGEIRSGERAARLETATWSPVLGFVIKDSLFPHVSGGLRGREVTITSIEVQSLISLTKRMENELSAAACSTPRGPS